MADRQVAPQFVLTNEKTMMPYKAKPDDCGVLRKESNESPDPNQAGEQVHISLTGGGAPIFTGGMTNVMKMNMLRKKKITMAIKMGRNTLRNVCRFVTRHKELKKGGDDAKVMTRRATTHKGGKPAVITPFFHHGKADRKAPKADKSGRFESGKDNDFESSGSQPAP
jgi:hypothetical protein